MGLLDKYKESLEEEGIKVDIKLYKPKKEYTKLVIVVIMFAVGIPTSFLIAGNYASCMSTFTALANANTNSTSVSSPFSLGCATNTSMYSVALVIALVVIALLIMKIQGIRKVKF